jgi:hypothetical protein
MRACSTYGRYLPKSEGKNALAAYFATSFHYNIKQHSSCYAVHLVVEAGHFYDGGVTKSFDFEWLGSLNHYLVGLLK